MDFLVSQGQVVEILDKKLHKYNLTFHLDDDNLLHPNFYNGLDELVKDEEINVYFLTRLW